MAAVLHLEQRRYQDRRRRRSLAVPVNRSAVAGEREKSIDFLLVPDMTLVHRFLVVKEEKRRAIGRKRKNTVFEKKIICLYSPSYNLRLRLRRA